VSSAIEERSFIFAEPDLYEMVACHRDDIVMRTIRECKRKSNGTVDKAQAPPWRQAPRPASKSGQGRGVLPQSPDGKGGALGALTHRQRPWIT
jgi:hypothetical protein